MTEIVKIALLILSLTKNFLSLPLNVTEFCTGSGMSASILSREKEPSPTSGSVQSVAYPVVSYLIASSSMNFGTACAKILITTESVFRVA